MVALIDNGVNIYHPALRGKIHSGMSFHCGGKPARSILRHKHWPRYRHGQHDLPRVSNGAFAGL
jgi:hypothetical protein